MKLASIVLIFGLANQVISVPVQGDEIFKNFIQSMKNQINLDEDPCQDFDEYACGKLEKPPRDSTEEQEEENELMEKIYEKILNDKPSNSLEEKVQKYFQSCEKAAGNWPVKPDVHNEVKLDNILKDLDAFKTISAWPVDTDLNLVDYSKLLAEAASIRDIFGYILVEPNNGKLEIYAPNHGSFPNYKSDDEKYILEAMNKHSPKTVEANTAAAKEIEAFETKLGEILKEKIEKTNIKIDEVAGINFNEFLTILKKNWVLDDKMEAIIIDQRIPKIAELLKQTNSKIVANHIVYKIYDFISEKVRDACTSQQYFTPAIIDRVWKETVSAEDQKNYLDTLKSFEKAYKEVLTKEGTNEYDEIEEELEITYDAIENRGEWFKELKYEEIIIDEKNFLQNVLNVGRFFINSYEMLAYDNFQMRLMSHFYLLKDFKKMGPMLHYLVTKNLQLWGSAFSSNPNWIKTQQPQHVKCLKENQNVEIPIYDAEDVLQFFASQMKNFEAFKTYLTEMDKKQLELEEKVLNDNELSYTKAYYIALKQYSCVNRAKYVDLTFANTNEFSEAFSCKMEDPMKPKNKCSVNI